MFPSHVCTALTKNLCRSTDSYYHSIKLFNYGIFLQAPIMASLHPKTVKTDKTILTKQKGVRV